MSTFFLEIALVIHLKILNFRHKKALKAAKSNWNWVSGYGRRIFVHSQKVEFPSPKGDSIWAVLGWNWAIIFRWNVPISPGQNTFPKLALVNYKSKNDHYPGQKGLYIYINFPPIEWKHLISIMNNGHITPTQLQTWL